MLDFLKSYYFLIIILTIATIISFLWLLIFNLEKLHAKIWELAIVSITHTVFGVICVRFFALLEAGFVMEKAGTLSMFGGIFFMPLFYLVYSKIKKLRFLDVLDIFTISLVETLLLARINCFFSGCCLGKQINYEMRYPTREIELVYDLVFITIALFFIFKGKFKNKIYFFYLLSYGIMRFVIEFMRESNSGSIMHIAHVWSLISIIFSIGYLIISKYLKTLKTQ